MNKLKRSILKDKYGVMRGCIIMCVLLLLCACLTIYVCNKSSVLDTARSAESSAAQAVRCFDRMLDDSVLLLKGAADALADSPLNDHAANEAVLNQLNNSGPFSAVYIDDADGVMDEVVINAAESIIEIRTSIPGGRELVASLDRDDLHAVFSGLLNGEYEYEVYSINTGAYLLHSDAHTNESYYDMLLDMSDKGNLEILINGDDNSNSVLRFKDNGSLHYIAQAESSRAICGVSMIIPEELLLDNGGSMLPQLIVLSVILLLMASCILSACITMRRIRNSNRNIANALMMNDRMVDIAARDGRITLLVVSWKRDGIFACHDGLGLTSATSAIRSISDMEQACGMDNGEMERVYECLNKLAENESAELTVHCYTTTREDRLLRISFHRTESKEKNFLCCISDCTHEQAAQYRAEQELSYIENVRKRTTSIWQVNVSRNRWRVLHTHEQDPMCKLAAGNRVWRDYSSDLGGAVSEYMHPADYPAFSEQTGIPALAAAFRSGTSEFTMDYRMSTGGNGYAWHRMCVRLWLDPKTNDILANYYVYNVDAKKNAELERGERKRVLQQSMMALSGIYSGLYYVDLDNDLCYTARSLGGDLTDQLCTPYKSTFDAYIETAVHPDDREKLRAMLSAYAIKRSMTEGSHFRRCSYQRRVGDDSYADAAIVLQPARFENGVVKEITIAIRYTDQHID